MEMLYIQYLIDSMADKDVNNDDVSMYVIVYRIQ
jgi:hypothetical protein